MREKIINGFEKYLVREDGTISNKKTGKTITPSYSDLGNGKVTLYNTCGERKSKSVAMLVAEAFLPKPATQENQPVHIIHKDGDNRNNNVDNLEWKIGSEQRASRTPKPLTEKQKRFNNTKKPNGKVYYKWTKSGSLIKSTERFREFIRGGNYYLIRKDVHKFKRGSYDFYEYKQMFIPRDDLKDLKRITKKSVGDKKMDVGDLLDNVNRFLSWKYTKELPSAKYKLATLYSEFTKRYTIAKENLLKRIENAGLEQDKYDEIVEAYVFDGIDFFDDNLNLFTTDQILEKANQDDEWKKNLKSYKDNFEYVQWYTLKHNKYI